MSLGDLSCRELVELVSDYLDGRLAPGERARFEGHLGGCPECALHLEQMRRTVAALGRLDADALRPHTRDALVRAFRDWRRAG